MTEYIARDDALNFNIEIELDEDEDLESVLKGAQLVMEHLKALPTVEMGPCQKK